MTHTFSLNSSSPRDDFFSLWLLAIISQGFFLSGFSPNYLIHSRDPSITPCMLCDELAKTEAELELSFMTRILSWKIMAPFLLAMPLWILQKRTKLLSLLCSSSTITMGPKIQVYISRSWFRKVDKNRREQISNWRAGFFFVPSFPWAMQLDQEGIQPVNYEGIVLLSPECLFLTFD